MQLKRSRKALERAKARHQAGDLAEAERLYLATLRHDAANAETLHRLSALYAQLGRFGEALQTAERAIGLHPGLAELHFHRGNLLCAVGRHEHAVESYRDALALSPEYVEAANNLGDTLLGLGRAEDALTQFERALALRPHDVQALNNRGNALRALGRTEEALHSYDAALAAAPRNTEVLANRANALLALGRHEDAQADMRSAAAQRPEYIEALLAKGKVQIQQRLYSDALQTYRSVIALQATNVMAWNDCGVALTELRRYREAYDCFLRVLDLQPDTWAAWHNRGRIHTQLSQFAKAVECYDKAVALAPGHALPHNDRGLALLCIDREDEALAEFQKVIELEPTHAYARGHIPWLKMRQCAWDRLDEETASTVSAVRSGEGNLLPFEFLPLSDRASDQLQCARRYASDWFPAEESRLWQGEAYRHERIRVAYVSADFRAHATSYLLTGLLERHDRSRFETFGVTFSPMVEDEWSRRTAAACEHFLDVRGLSDPEIAETLRSHEIDIAVDVMGFTNFCRTGVFALRPCPAQVNFIGYPGTMGAPYIDYLIADAFVVPVGRERDYAEKIVRLPDTFQCNDDRRRSAERIPGRREAGLPETGVVFCSFNDCAKITPALFDAWAQILRAVDGSVLWLFAQNAPARRNLLREAEARGIHASRIVFATRIAYADHLARLQLADVFLDCWRFNGGATASDALWSGVPVVTLPGDAFAARMAGSLLHAIGMPELITASPEEYQALAVRLGREPDFLAATKAKLAANRATYPLFNTDRYRRHIEAAYVAMWQRVQRGEPPADITVAPID
jgi:predicted O-linked N-acetylglucosamine transferase (SPINDLY family)